ncbi:S8 family peptidase [Flavobacterium psychrotrophum]|uniref:S8 family peptidase n=1 Tax=Flavobacterium psychrotrophum TaxID=2294119 RepID=UPI000E30FDDB|nr:S8 family peptidase [Flavobacterium psychrotrophum]
MKKTTLLAVLLFAPLTFFAQNRKGNLHLQPNSQHELYVAFNSSDMPKGYDGLVKTYGIAAEPGIDISAEKLDAMEALALKNTGNGASVNRLRNIYKLSITDPTNERLLSLGRELEKLDGVAYCSLASLTPVKPPLDIEPVTPLYENQQTYIGTAGVKMDYAWNLGLNGQGINIRDVEYGFNPNHEDLNEVSVGFAQGMVVSNDASTNYTEHGTAVLGVLVGDKGNYGISGMAYGANEAVLFPEWTTVSYNRTRAISRSIAASAPGDVILFELQVGGTETDPEYPDNYVAGEYDNVVWDLTRAATDTGIIIVAAAGNGGQNLDAPDYAEYMDRGNSGAIMVGAGNSTGTRRRLNFSTYGARVDVQGWGQGVLTSGYGDYVTIDNDFNQQYTMFSGTSSATPIVASCVVVLQSYYHSLTDTYFSPAEMRDLLISTGQAQGSASTGHIGPLPNMQAAIVAIQNLLGVSGNTKALFTAYPNPVQDKLTLNAEVVSAKLTAEVYTTMGQKVYSSTLNGMSQIDFSAFAAGVYIVKVTDGDKVTTRRIVKN